MTRKIVLILFAAAVLAPALTAARPSPDRFDRIRRDLDSLCAADPRFGSPVRR